MPTRFLAHPDPRVLLDWLRRDIEDRRSDDPLAPLVVLAPNRLLAGELRRRLTQGGRAWLGVRVLDLWALASDILGRGGSGERPVLLAPEPLLRERVRRCLAQSGGEVARFAERRPGLAGSLLSSLNELREAGVTASDAAALLAGEGVGRGHEALRLYPRYLAELAELERRGWVDRAGAVERAASGAAAWARQVAAIHLYGAYELIGVHARLLRAAADGAPVHILLPVDPELPAWSYGARIARGLWLHPGETLERLPDPASAPPLALAARALYDESAAPAPPMEGGFFELLHAQGAEAELTAVARRVLDLVRRGTAPAEIGVVARSLAPYAPHLARVFGAHGIPFSTSAVQPLARFPAAAALRSLLRVLARDFERDDLLDLLRSPALRWPPGAVPRPDLLERWSAGASISRGFTSWSEDLPAWVEASADGSTEDGEERAPSVAARQQALAQQLELLRRLHAEAAAWGRCGGWEESVGFAGELAQRWLLGPEAGAPVDAAAAALSRVLEEARIAAAAAGGSNGGAQQVLEVIEGAIEAATLPVQEHDRGGVRVLDGMQARGHLFEALFLIGFNAGAFPLRRADDPFLSEACRLRLRSQAGRPVPLRLDPAEDHQLLALWVSACAGALAVSYRRADEDGRAEIPSFALREVARLALGRPDTQALLDAATRIPVHPLERILEWGRRPGLVAPAEQDLAVALGGGHRAARLGAWLTAAGRGEEGLAAALSWMEARAAGWGRVEGLSGPPGADFLPAAWSPNRLQALSRCPLQYFFRHVLRPGVVPEPPAQGEFEPAEWGARAHALLEEVYQILGRENRLEAGAGALRDEEKARCRDLVEGMWDIHFGDLLKRLGRRLPLLWEARARLWRQALCSFVVRDVGSWRAAGLGLAGLERPGSASLEENEGGAGPPVPLRGLVDRVVEWQAAPADPDVPPARRRRLRVGDYKTSARLEPFVDAREVLGGLWLQAPLYARIEAAQEGIGVESVDVEFLGIGPAHEESPAGARAEISGGEIAAWWPGVAETVRTLAGLAASGRFPLHHGRHCEWCDYEAACHHLSPEARAQLRRDPGHRDYYDTLRKSTTKKTLAEVRAKGGDE